MDYSKSLRIVFLCVGVTPITNISAASGGGFGTYPGTTTHRDARRLATVIEERDSARRYGGQLRFERDAALSELEKTRVHGGLNTKVLNDLSAELKKNDRKRQEQLDALSTTVVALQSECDGLRQRQPIQQNKNHEDLLNRAHDIVRIGSTVKEKTNDCLEKCPLFLIPGMLGTPLVLLGGAIAGPAGVKAGSVAVAAGTLYTVNHFHVQNRAYKAEYVDPKVESFWKTLRQHNEIVNFPEFERIFNGTSEHQKKYYTALIALKTASWNARCYLNKESSDLHELINVQNTEWKKYATSVQL